ncbi:MAG: preprotein translocase subunit SecG [Bacteroidota bacterium]|jgi:preprotein translocase subunit SecG
MLTFISVLIIVACVLLTLIVLIQNPKGGGIAANFIAPNQIMGVKRSTDVVEKATWILAGVLIVLSLSTNFFRGSSSAETEGPQSEILNNFDGSSVPAAPPTVPASPENGAQNQEQPAAPAQ